MLQYMQLHPMYTNGAMPLARCDIGVADRISVYNDYVVGSKNLDCCVGIGAPKRSRELGPAKQGGDMGRGGGN